MYNSEFSFIILTLNEELHLQRLLDSIQTLRARTFVLDSGSTDSTLQICRANQVEFAQHAFENHPKQWQEALNRFIIPTPWVICLDADQAVGPRLLNKLLKFKASNYTGIQGIYFNRKYFFKGTWIRHGGHYPKYLLKMFEYRQAHSDLQENMDHRFVVSGKTICWKDGELLEENLKENCIQFWISKHNTYSELLAQEELERRLQLRQQSIKPNLFGSPDERNAWQKRLWWQLPLYLRPFLYFVYRMIFRLGILDGRMGFIYHFLQGFWFRLLVDIKINEKMMLLPNTVYQNNPAIGFTFRFLMLFSCFYGTQQAFIGLSAPGGYYSPIFDQFNYIEAWRNFNIRTAAEAIELLGYEVIQRTSNSIRVSGRAGFVLVYSCLGYGIMSLMAAFILAYPKPMRSRLLFLGLSLIVIQVANSIRLVLIALYARKASGIFPDHHNLYNSMLYLLMAALIYLWLNHYKYPNTHHESNKPPFKQNATP